jgi:thiamine-monophosphate kinase
MLNGMTNGRTAEMRGAELDLLRQIRGRVRRSTGVALGIGDDCALLRVRPGEEIAVTTDLSIDGRHFRVGWHPPESVGHRTLARGLSDLAAMGARPVAAFVSLGLPKELVKAGRTGRSWVSRFYDGLLGLAEEHHTTLAGGDLAESPLALADVVLVGAVPRGHALLRSGAKPGDAVYVTGALGGAAAGLDKLAGLAETSTGKKQVRLPDRWRVLLQTHLYPQPRLAQGEWLRRYKIAAAAIDLSDGLSTDLAHICEESGVGAEVDAAALPISVGATLERALHGGEDYELLFTARPGKRVPSKIAGVPITRIGRITEARRGKEPITLLTAEGPRPLTRRGWEHFG